MAPEQLISAIRAALDETERIAREAIGAPFAPDWAATYPRIAESGTHQSGKWWACAAKWNNYEGAAEVVRAQVWPDGHDHADPTYSGPAPYVVSDIPTPLVEHIAHNDPAAVLRRVAADREIVDAYEQALNDNRYGIAEVCDEYRDVILPALARGLGINPEEN